MKTMVSIVLKIESIKFLNNVIVADGCILTILISEWQNFVFGSTLF